MGILPYINLRWVDNKVVRLLREEKGVYVLQARNFKLRITPSILQINTDIDRSFSDYIIEKYRYVYISFNEAINGFDDNEFVHKDNLNLNELQINEALIEGTPVISIVAGPNHQLFSFYYVILAPCLLCVCIPIKFAIDTVSNSNCIKVVIRRVFS